MQEFNLAGQYAGKKLEEIELTELVFGSDTAVAVGSHNGEETEKENADEAAPLDGCMDEELQPDLQNEVLFDEFDFGDEEEVAGPSKKRNSASTQVKWTEKEEEEIQIYFIENFKTQSTPGRKECEKAINLSKLNNGVLYRRSWETIKKKVWNEIRKK